MARYRRKEQRARYIFTKRDFTNNKNKMKDIRTNMNNTVDLKLTYAIEYIESRGLIVADNLTIIQRIFMKSSKIAFISFLMSLVYITYSIFGIIEVHAGEANEMSVRDKIRLERLQVCLNEAKVQNITTNKLELHELVLGCAIRMHGVYIFESGYGKSDLCIYKNNCLGIKNKVNGYYGHNGFETKTIEREAFAYYYMKYHRTKTPRTFIWGYKQADGDYRYGWARGNREVYTQHLNTIENNTELKREYEYLYFTN